MTVARQRERHGRGTAAGGRTQASQPQELAVTGQPCQHSGSGAQQDECGVGGCRGVSGRAGFLCLPSTATLSSHLAIHSRDDATQPGTTQARRLIRRSPGSPPRTVYSTLDAASPARPSGDHPDGLL
ncbi:hypothetical protein VTN02DRAFT_473 [Thermoascus thermophilus]